MSRVSISRKAARALVDHLDRYGHDAGTPAGLAREELRRALEPKRKAPDAAGMALAADLKARANATRRAFGLAPLPYPKMVGDRERVLRKESKRERRAEIRRKVFERAAEGQGYERCEGPKWHILLGEGPDFRDIYGRCEDRATDLAHAFGKGNGRMPESERNCTAYCRNCSIQETNNRPSGEFWWSFRMAFFLAHGFPEEAREAGRRAAFVEVRAALPSSPRTRHD